MSYRRTEIAASARAADFILMTRSYGRRSGRDYLFALFKPRLERELGHELSQQIFVENPAGAFALSVPVEAQLRPPEQTMEVMS